ncbi:hypothetical protein [Paraclostridium sordellii]|uniref:hypothetical protein n=1 Tax=Paraclostridium sordellii TaxID=1505 RepID=UPI0022DF30E9|nr:hypothetical protein [Paeniclostridium sordellii]
MVKKILNISFLVLMLLVMLTGCSKENDEKTEDTSAKNTEIKKVSTVLGDGEVIPLRNGFKEILPGEFFIKIPCTKEPTNQEIIKVYNDLNSSDLKFNYFLITFGDYGIHFPKDVPIGSKGPLDNSPDSIQPGSQISSTEQYLKIENNSISIEDKKAS